MFIFIDKCNLQLWYMYFTYSLAKNNTNMKLKYSSNISNENMIVGSSPSQVKPQTVKLVFVASLLSMRH
jgi:hypothetical protein